MQRQRTITLSVAVWALLLITGGIAAGVSLFGWVVLATLAIVPPIFILRWSNGPVETMSETIQHELVSTRKGA